MAFFRSSFFGGVTAARERNFDRSFILFGKGSSGKSTLSNLLMANKLFEVHEFPQAYGLTKKVQWDTCKIEADQIYDLKGENTEMLNIQVFDQPGSNDHDFTQEKHGHFLKECIAATKAEMAASLLILINLSSKFFNTEELLTLLNLSEILSISGYNFFTNAIVVFTHADEIVPEMNQDTLQEKLKTKLETENFECVQELLDLVENRYTFINGIEKSDRNRIEILRILFQLTRPKLKVYINGNNGFQGDELKELLKENILSDNFEKKLLKYDVEYHFNPDLNLFKRLEKKTLGEKITNALDKLSGISKGISAMVLLISLEEVFNENMYNLILNLPKTYNLGEEFKKDFWDYACIVFYAPVDKKECITSNIAHNRLLKMIDAKVTSRYTWVTCRTSAEECSTRLTNLIKRVKQDTEGKSYTDSVVLAEMNQMIKGAGKLREKRGKTQMGIELKDKELREAVPFYQLKPNSKVLVNSNNFFWEKESISPQIGHFILKNINSDIAEDFRKKYPDKEKRIPTEEYSEFCLKAMKKI